MEFDSFNGKNWLRASLDNANESVGRVTVLHVVFMAILMEAVYGDIKEAAKMTHHLFGNGGNDEYVSPVAAEVLDVETNVKKITVSPGLVGKAIEALSSVKSTKENIVAACKDFVAFGRMFQEMTIDAAKLGTKVVIPYLKQAQQFKLMSRLRGFNDFNVKAVWTSEDAPRKGWKRLTGENSGCIESIYDDGLNRFVRFGKVVRYLVKDPFHKASLALLHIVEHVGLWLTSFKPEFSGKLIKSIDEKVRTDVNFRALVRMSMEYKQAYRTIYGCMRKELDDINDKTSDPYDREAWEKVVRSRYRKIYAALSNEMRRGYDILAKHTGVNYGTNNRVMANLYAAFHRDNGELLKDEMASKFADTVMEEEFFLFMTQCMRQAGEKGAEYTEDKLRRCDFPEGAVVDFVGGEAELPMIMEDGREEVFIASADEELDGRFLIRLDKNGNKVASRKIEKMVKVPAADHSKLVFQTVANVEVGSNVNDFIRAAMGKEVVLLNYVGDKSNKVRQPVILNGKIVSRFRKMDDFAVNGKTPSIVRGYDAVYGAKAGKVVNAVTSIQEVNGETIPVAVVVLEDVHDVDPRNYSNVSWDLKKTAVPAAISGFTARVQRKAASSKPSSSEKKILPMNLSAADEFEEIFG